MDKKRINIAFLGDKQVGKSSLIERYINNTFIDNNELEPTILKIKEYEYENKKYNLNLLDCCNKNLDLLKSLNFKDTGFIVLVYDITNRKTFVNLEHWIDLICNLCSVEETDIFLAVVGNKSDLTENIEITKENGEFFCQLLNANFVYASAKEENSFWSNDFENIVSNYICYLEKKEKRKKEEEFYY